MSKFAFAAIYKTYLIREEFSVQDDNLSWEVIKGPKSFKIPVQGASAFPKGYETVIMGSDEFVLNDLDFYLVIKAETDEENPFKARIECENLINKGIAIVSASEGSEFFVDRVYYGWIYENKNIIAGGWVKMVDKTLEEKSLIEALKRFDVDLGEEERFELVAKFYSKSLEYKPSEEKYILLWTAMEIFPMENTSHIQPLIDFLSGLLSRPSPLVKEKLDLGKLYGYRTKLIHDGKFDIPPEIKGDVFTKVENIVIEIIRSMIGLPYSGSLEKYFD